MLYKKHHNVEKDRMSSGLKENKIVTSKINKGWLDIKFRSDNCF